MTKLEIKLKYYDLISKADKTTLQQISDCQTAIEADSDARRNAAIEALNHEQHLTISFSDSMAEETRLVVKAYNDNNHPAHDFAVAYVDAVRNQIDRIEVEP